MPPRGVQKGTKRARQYEHIKDSEKEQGASASRAEEIAARTVNKERARSGESRTRSRSSTQDKSLVPARRRALGHQPAEGPHARPALCGGEEPPHRGAVVDEQGPAPARRRRQAVLRGGARWRHARSAGTTTTRRWRSRSPAARRIRSTRSSARSTLSRLAAVTAAA